jgi:diaminopimelate decarboxylase
MSRTETLGPGAWGLGIGPDGALAVSGCSAVELVRAYGTPLHVIDRPRLEATARACRDAFAAACPFPVRVHYAYKCNSVPAVAETVKRSGLQAEVMSSYELRLALALGHSGDAIVVNGPYKPESFLRECLDAHVRYIVADSVEELRLIDWLARAGGRRADVLLRINPDYTPHGMNQGSATASRRGCAFGLDLAGGEADRVLTELPGMSGIAFHGFHFHIGTGIDHPGDYSSALARLRGLIGRYRSAGVRVGVLDVGGGFAATTTREMTTLEMLLYQGVGHLPATAKEKRPGFAHFADAVRRGIAGLFPEKDWPEVIIEPGRSIASSCQLLLLGVHAVKERPGAGKWLITDGGLGTVTMPTFYECHEVLLADDPERPRTEQVTIVGPVCFAGDVVYRNKLMPTVRPGEVLALMDSGAYFTALESSFGFPRPAIAVAENGRHRLARRREIFADMVGRDEFCLKKEEKCLQ